MNFILLFFIWSSSLAEAHVVLRLDTRTVRRDLTNNSTVFTLRLLGFDMLIPRNDDGDIVCDKCSGTKCERGAYMSRDDSGGKKCPPGEKPNLKRDRCQPVLEDSDKKGRYETGGVLDPSEGAQDKNTPTPKCIPDWQKQERVLVHSIR